jgi:hypothetical protein
LGIKPSILLSHDEARISEAQGARDGSGNLTNVTSFPISVRHEAVDCHLRADVYG